MISNGAEHSTNLARTVADAAFGGEEGIVQAAALEVKALDVPGSSVQVYPGTCAIKNRATGATGELYVAINRTVDTVPISPTAGSGRSDLIVVRVEDPNEPGASWDIPGDVANGPYVFTRVISNVPSTTTSAQDLGLDHSMIALARIDIPSSTGTITQSMIHDLRTLSQQRSTRRFEVFNAAVQETYTANSAWMEWPNAVSFSVEVPTWATHMRGTFQINLLAAANGGATSNAISGFMALQIDTPGQTGLRTANTLFLVDAAWVQPLTVFGGGEDVFLPEAFRGKTCTLRVAITSGNTPSLTDVLVWMANQGVASIDVEFYQAPIAASASGGFPGHG
jgi:hypothetical protein